MTNRGNIFDFGSILTVDSINTILLNKKNLLIKTLINSLESKTRVSLN